MLLDPIVLKDNYISAQLVLPNGQAAKKFDAEFIKMPSGKGELDQKRISCFCQTPGYSSWQENIISCCQDYCAYQLQLELEVKAMGIAEQVLARL